MLLTIYVHREFLYAIGTCIHWAAAVMTGSRRYSPHIVRAVAIAFYIGPCGRDELLSLDDMEYWDEMALLEFVLSSFSSAVLFSLSDDVWYLGTWLSLGLPASTNISSRDAVVGKSRAVIVLTSSAPLREGALVVDEGFK